MGKRIFKDENVFFIRDGKEHPGFVKIRVIKKHIYELITEGGKLTEDNIEELPCDEVIVPKNTLIKFIIEEFIKPQKIEKIKKMNIVDFL